MKYYYHIVPMLLMILLISGCSGVGGRQPTPTPPVPIETLLLEPDLFPGWQVGEKDTSNSSCSVLGCGDELERIHVQFIYKSPQSQYSAQVFDPDADVLSTHWIWRYRSVRQAYEGYKVNLDDYGPEIDQSPTQEISYTSTVAQHMTVNCQKTAHVFCSTVAQYGVYVVNFTSYIDQENMSYDDYERILAEIDKKMASVADVP